MANTIITKNSATASAVPTSGDLVQGELAVNVTDKRLFTENSGGTVVELGTNPSQLNFADNAKAIFGAGSDLQIYHDGSNSIIADVGTGNLNIQGNNLILEDPNGVNFLGGNGSTGAVTVYYNGVAKLATTSTGIDVTGTVVSDGLTVSGDASISGTVPKLVLKETDTTDVNTMLRNSGGVFGVRTLNDAETAAYDRLTIDHATGDISFYEDTGTTAKFFWDASADSLGIGTATPATALDVSSSSGISTSHGGCTLELLGRGDLGYAIVGTDTNHPLLLRTNNTERLRIDSSGNVGIGTSNASSVFNQANKLVVGDTTTNNGISIAASTTGNSRLAFIDELTSTAGLSSGGLITYDHTNDQFKFRVTGTDRLTLDSAGNLGLGVTPASDWYTTNWRAFQIGTSASLASWNGAATLDRVFLSSNAKNTSTSQFGGWDYINSLPASQYVQLDGTHEWRVAATGTAGASIAWTQAMTLTSSANLNLGTTTSSAITGSMSTLTIGGTNSTVSGGIALQTNGVVKAYDYVESDVRKIQTVSGVPIAFVAGGTERARITSTGELLVGGISSLPSASVYGFGVQGQTIYTSVASTSLRYHHYFYNANGQVGSISTSGSATSYTTSSDYRLKENWVPVVNASTRVNALKPVNFAWKASGERVDGFLAHELAEVVPEAVTGEKDAVDAEGKPKYQGIDQSKLVPLLTAALQEALAKIESLEARLDAANL